MKRNNLTAAVLAGLAGIAGIAGTAQAVNMNPDGLGQVLVYSYYTTNDGNQTLLSVVNTSDEVKAVKVRFLEGYNSREVLDFNLYLSPKDVWVAAIADDEGTPTLLIPDNSCTVPYLYSMGVEEYGMGKQEFLPYAFTGDNADGGPTDISRAAEGYFEVIEMGTVDNSEARDENEMDDWFDPDEDPGRIGSAEAATHEVKADGTSAPADCDQLVRNWTDYEGSDALKDDPYDGMWFDNADGNGNCNPSDPDDQDDTDCHTVDTDVTTNSGGIFGGAAIVNAANGTMFSYDAKAIQDYDRSDDGVHYIPGTIHPSLNDGDQTVAHIFTGAGVITLNYFIDDDNDRSIDAVSATMMHDTVMNEFTIEEGLNAATEWVFTFPTKNFYVDPSISGGLITEWHPDPDDEGCRGWDPGEEFPPRSGPDYPDDIEGDPDDHIGWEQCTYIKTVSDDDAFPPFTSLFGDPECEVIGFESWDREEDPTVTEHGVEPPIVSPAPPGDPTPGVVDFILCHEVNVMRFGPNSIFGTTSDLLVEVENTHPNGWASMDFSWTVDLEDDNGEGPQHVDTQGLIGLPVVGFAAQQYENGFLEGGTVLANYGGLFGHKSSVRQCQFDDEGACGSGL